MIKELTKELKVIQQELLTCKDEVNHVEIRPVGKYTYQDFLDEFNAGIFVNGERVYK